VTPALRIRLLVVLLRVAGIIMVTAFLAIVLPTEWMAATHRWLGLGEFPRAPIVEYLARSIAALYGFHGVLLLIIARNPIAHRPFVWYIAIMNVLFGIVITAINLEAGLPLVWTLLEGPPVMAFGIASGTLARALPPEGGSPQAD
jgi:hypothetical protein